MYGEVTQTACFTVTGRNKWAMLGKRGLDDVHEEVNQKVVSLCVRSAKMSATEFAKVLKILASIELLEYNRTGLERMLHNERSAGEKQGATNKHEKE